MDINNIGRTQRLRKDNDMFKTIKGLKEELIGEEMSFTALDNYMMNNGYYSVFDDGVTDNVKEDLNVAYLPTNGEPQALIYFEITIDNGEGEAHEAFYLKVLDVQTL